MSIVEDLRKQEHLVLDLKALEEGFSTAECVATARHEQILAELRTAKAVAAARHEAIIRALEKWKSYGGR